MTVLDFLRDSFRHMEWADAEVWKTVFTTPDAAGDSELRDSFLHIHMVQQAFLHVWLDEAFDFQAAISSHTDLSAISEWGRQYHRDVVGFFAPLDESSLERPVVLPWASMFASRIGREAETPTLRETLYQVAMHSAYHRGQVATRLRKLGSEPPLTDFIIWAWAGKPEPQWPAPTA